MNRCVQAETVWRVLRENRDRVMAALLEGRFVAVHLSTWGFLDQLVAFLDQAGFSASLEAFGKTVTCCSPSCVASPLTIETAAQLAVS